MDRKKLIPGLISILISLTAIVISTVNLATITNRNKANEEGYNDRKIGKTLIMNPHPSEDLHVQWGLGWFRANNELLSKGK